MFRKILIANRGEIAVRIIRACHEMGVKTVAVYSDVDRTALHVRFAHEAYHIGASPSNESYLVIDRIIDVEFGANLATSIEVIRVGGTIATYSSTVVPQPELPFFQLMYKDLAIRFVIVYAMPESAKQFAIADIERALDNDLLQHRIAHTLPLDEIVRGNELVEGGELRGAVVLETN